MDQFPAKLGDDSMDKSLEQVAEFGIIDLSTAISISNMEQKVKLIFC